MTNATLKLKGSTLTTVILELQQYDETTFYQELAEKVQQAPALFEDAPLLIDLKDDNLDTESLASVCEQCRQLGFKPLAVQTAFYSGETTLAGLPRLSHGVSSRAKKIVAVKPEVVVETVTQHVDVYKPALIIDKPVRSGQQVYAKDADLIVNAQVSEGAEVIADGNIHIYGNLRGRALAGAQGNTEARIFCQKLEAELVSIAGCFRLKDSIIADMLGKSVQITLKDDEPVITAL